MPRFDSIISQTKDLKTPKDRAHVVLTDIIFHVNDALNSDNMEYNLRQLRDDLEQQKAELIRSLDTADNRGPNAPDDSESKPADVDPLRYDEATRRQDTRVGELKPRLDDSEGLLSLGDGQEVDTADSNGRFPGEEGFDADDAADRAKIVADHENGDDND